MCLLKECSNLPLNVYHCKEGDIEYGVKLGEGLSEVYKIKFREKSYAGKVYEDTELEEIRYELEIAKRLEGVEQCVQTYGVLVIDDKLILLIELLNSHGDLYDYISKKQRWTACYKRKRKNTKQLIPKPKSHYLYYNEEEDIYWCYELSEKQKMKITLSLVKALSSLHHKNIIHGDLKTNNAILHYMDKKQIIKLIDFGMSYFSETDDMIDIEYKCGTMGYRAPEQEEYKMNYQSDVYSLAVTVIEMWNGEIWIDGESFKECRKEVLSGLRKIVKHHTELGNLLRKCLNLDPKKRPLLQKVLDSLEKIIRNDHKYRSCPQHSK
jgi:serine/threonine protein kinase